MPDAMTMDGLKSLIREIPDYPKPGILFYDLTTLLQDYLERFEVESGGW
jgi:adenine phosphoribosyltransferase